MSPQTWKFNFQISSNFRAVGGLKGEIRNKNNDRGKMCYWSILAKYFEKRTNKICILEMFDTNLFLDFHHFYFTFDPPQLEPSKKK